MTHDNISRSKLSIDPASRTTLRSVERSRLMSVVRQSGTSLELEVRAFLRDSSHAYETNSPDLPGKPDLVSREKKWAIYVNGCFWHGHKKCQLARLPKTNKEFWSTKIATNRRRDRVQMYKMRKLKYSTMVIWGCELRIVGSARRKVEKFVSSCYREVRSA